MPNLTSIGVGAPNVDYHYQDGKIQSTKQEGGVSGFLGRMWNALTRSPAQKHANREAVREYIGQVAQRFGLSSAKQVQRALSGHLVKGNPLSSTQIAILNQSIPKRNEIMSTDERLGVALMRLGTGKPIDDFGKLLASPCKQGAWQAVKDELRKFDELTAKLSPEEKARAVEKLEKQIVKYLQENNLTDIQVFDFKAKVLEPLFKGELHRVYEPGRDLTTPQSEKTSSSQGALRTAFGNSSAMVLAQAAKETSTLHTLQPDTAQRARNLFGTLREYAAKATTKEQMAVLKEVMGLMNKGFSPGIAGIGRFDGKGTLPPWDPAWTKTGFKVGESLNHPDNQTAQANLLAMLNYFEVHAGEYLDKETTNVHQQDLRSLQVHGTLGQVLNDIVYEGRLDQGCRDELLGMLQERGVFLSGQGDKDEFVKFKDQLRQSPLLMELKNAEVVKGMQDAIGKTLEPLRPPDIDDGEWDRLKTLVGARVGASLTRDGEEISGARGRFALGPSVSSNAKKAFDGFSRDLSNRSAPVNNCMDLPDGKLDDEALDRVGNLVTGTSRDKVDEFVQLIKDTDLLGHGMRPITVQREYTLPTRMREGIEDPLELLSGLQTDTDEDKALLKTFTDHVKTLIQQPEGQRSEEIKTGIQAMKDEIAKTTIKDKQGREHTLGDVAQDLSIANLIHSHELRTLCSISGTTTDIGLALRCQMGPQLLREHLTPLLEYARGNRTDLPDMTRELFTSISFFMQSGQYHTPAEVLGGLFITAIAVQDPKLFNPDNPKDLRDGYSRLLGGLAKSPEKFFSVPDGDQDSFRERIGEQGRELERTQIEQIKQRLNSEHLSSFEAPPAFGRRQSLDL
ncbi:hypothetical protein [Pseudothauera rhizosphaerae]|uniref:Uncharacterized protein n=1 Tax=Pseudothauera rhizosphaerae TaxID=2565932 RepID=A0A4S4AVR9_9RHOO|nr:hypothetical protein [Pseudothauera rhizosphaerae]THF64109.1 hypothetical protein E6O51_01940 [Pseudothauera rhizosphaerae]